MEPTSAPSPSQHSGTNHPGISVIMTVLNEERHLRAAVTAIVEQDYPGPVEVILALGPSSDGTDGIAAELTAADSRVRTVPNPEATTPRGLNIALKEATHDIIVRVDGHSVLPAGYLRTAVEVLEETGADNVGGIMAAEGTTTFEKAVACAMNSWLGVGGASFHLGGEAGPAETVYLGAFRRSALERVGGYDEALSRAQDWELNYRIRRSGGTVWFTPQMRVSYRPRGDLRGLAKQFFRTGQWRRKVIRLHTKTLSPRYLAPPLAVVGIAGGLVAGAAGFTPAFVLPGGYVLVILGGSVLTGRGEALATRVLLPAVYAVMHTAWGLGFLFSPRKAG
ncbi:glycosyltransferase family 2 protein [Haloechinothrix sp. LS1_15]|uniref:glycosyltransferase family 2 protein n=1 Tax=Haloechinothrix sp. LS1_15 TaxID=2652248 RepID=UPI002947594E|nr:glycosyltransferase family 2 protein [Haloechinothrix sp. LS1_15]MDV6011093.1 glycosyltransferase family 2 protein [Haloechinothrix sp. LS1_15]